MECSVPCVYTVRNIHPAVNVPICHKCFKGYNNGFLFQTNSVHTKEIDTCIDKKYKLAIALDVELLSYSSSTLRHCMCSKCERMYGCIYIAAYMHLLATIFISIG